MKKIMLLAVLFFGSVVSSATAGEMLVNIHFNDDVTIACTKVKALSSSEVWNVTCYDESEVSKYPKEDIMLFSMKVGFDTKYFSNTPQGIVDMNAELAQFKQSQ